jgi:hypothetical protein
MKLTCLWHLKKSDHNTAECPLNPANLQVRPTRVEIAAVLAGSGKKSSPKSRKDYLREYMREYMKKRRQKRG